MLYSFFFFVFFLFFTRFRKISARVYFFFSRFNIAFDRSKFYLTPYTLRSLDFSHNTNSPYISNVYMIHIDGSTFIIFSLSHSFVGNRCFVYIKKTNHADVFWVFSCNVYNSNTFFCMRSVPVYKNLYNILGNFSYLY